MPRFINSGPLWGVSVRFVVGGTRRDGRPGWDIILRRKSSFQTTPLAPGWLRYVRTANKLHLLRSYIVGCVGVEASRIVSWGPPFITRFMIKRSKNETSKGWNLKNALPGGNFFLLLKTVFDLCPLCFVCRLFVFSAFCLSIFCYMGTFVTRKKIHWRFLWNFVSESWRFPLLPNKHLQG